MEFRELLKARTSVRHFQSGKPVTEEQIRTILEAGVLAPSAGNIQPWRFTVVRSDEARARLNGALHQRWCASAPVAIVVSVDPRPSTSRYGDRGTTLYCIQDTAIATEHMHLAATDIGLGACWIGAFDEEKVAAAVGINRPITPVAILAIGYSAQASGNQSRRPVADVTRWI